MPELPARGGSWLCRRARPGRWRLTHASADGVELTFAVNVLANYLLVRLLWDKLTAPARIVLTGSGTHFGDPRHNRLVPGPRWEDPRALATPRRDDAARTVTAGRTAYSTSKLAVIYLTHELAWRLPAGTDVYTFDPGFVPDSGLVRDASPAVRFLARTLLRGLIGTPLTRPGHFWFPLRRQRKRPPG